MEKMKYKVIIEIELVVDASMDQKRHAADVLRGFIPFVKNALESGNEFEIVGKGGTRTFQTVQRYLEFIDSLA